MLVEFLVSVLDRTQNRLDYLKKVYWLLFGKEWVSPHVGLATRLVGGVMMSKALTDEQRRKIRNAIIDYCEFLYDEDYWVGTLNDDEYGDFFSHVFEWLNAVGNYMRMAYRSVYGTDFDSSKQ